MDIPGLLASFSTTFSVFAILSLSLNLEYGYAGQSNFGKVFFYSIGCYVAGYISTLFLLYFRGLRVDVGSAEAIYLRLSVAASDPALNALAFMVALVVAFILAGIAGYFASYPALKLREEFLGMTLLVVGEIARTVIRGEASFSGGSEGIAGIPNPFIWIDDVTVEYLSFAGVALGLLLLTYVVVDRLANSPYGRLLKSVRDDDIAAASLGKRVPTVRGQVLAVSSGFSGVAGVLYAYYSGFVQADSFTPLLTFIIFAMVIVGGNGNLKGSLLGAALISGIDLVTRVAALGWQSQLFNPNYASYLVYAVIIIVILIFRPKGLIPEKPIRTPAWDLLDEKENGRA